MSSHVQTSLHLLHTSEVYTGCLCRRTACLSPYGVCRRRDCSSLIRLKNVNSLQQLFCLSSVAGQIRADFSFHRLGLHVS